MTDDELLLEMAQRSLSAPPSNLCNIEDRTLRAECARRGFLPVRLDDSEVKAEAERRGMFAGEKERMAAALMMLNDEMRAEQKREEREYGRVIEATERERDEWERRYRARSDRQVGFLDALRLLWIALFSRRERITHREW